jgi:hypothetical protein
MCVVCFTVVGTIAVGAQLTPMPASEVHQAPAWSFSISQFSAVGMASPYSSVGKPLASVRNPISSVTSDPVDQCRIQEVSKARNFTWAGFPDKTPMTQRSGVVKWA